MGMDITNGQGRTIADICKDTGKDIDTVRKQWARTIGGQFSRYHIPSNEEMSVLFPDKVSSVKRQEKKVESVQQEVKKAVTNPPKRNGYNAPMIAVFILATGASVSNTWGVSHALSASSVTAAFITGVASFTALLMIYGRIKNGWYWIVAGMALAFEAFCNAVSVFKSLMGSMAYGLTTVSGKPSEFLDMVAFFTGRDHFDTAWWLSLFVAVMIGTAQVCAVKELRK